MSSAQKPRIPGLHTTSFYFIVEPFTSLLGYLLQILLQFAQVLLQILTATHVEELLFIAGQLLLLLTQLRGNVTFILLT